MDTFHLSQHANLRSHQRSLSDGDIRTVLAFGRVFNTADALIYFLDRTNIPDCDPQEAERLRGTAVIVAKDYRTIISCWRNRKYGRRNIHRKLSKSGYFSKPYTSRR